MNESHIFLFLVWKLTCKLKIVFIILSMVISDISLCHSSHCKLNLLKKKNDDFFFAVCWQNKNL